jgi:hypothetical protein
MQVNFFIAGLVIIDEKETVGGLGTIDKTGNYREWLHVCESFSRKFANIVALIDEINTTKALSTLSTT